MRPLRNVRLIEERLEAVSLFVNPDTEALATTLRSRLAKVKDLPVLVCKIKKASYSVTDWKSLFDSLLNGAMIVRALRASDNTALFAAKVSPFLPSCR